MPIDMPVLEDLFGPPLLPGLSYAPDMLDKDEERALVTALDPLPLKPFEFQGWLGKRQVISFGWRYDFTEARFARAADMPDFLLPLRDRAAMLAGLAGEDLVQTLVTRYDPGAGIGWHRDRPVFDTVIGISLLSAATIRFRRRTSRGFERFALPASPRSAYVLAGEARYDWEHSIASLDERRWSITFRSLSERGLAMQSEERG